MVGLRERCERHIAVEDKIAVGIVGIAGKDTLAVEGKGKFARALPGEAGVVRPAEKTAGLRARAVSLAEAVDHSVDLAGEREPEAVAAAAAVAAVGTRDTAARSVDGRLSDDGHVHSGFSSGCQYD